VFCDRQKLSKSGGHSLAEHIHPQRYDSARAQRGLRAEDRAEAETKGVETEKRWNPVDNQKRASSRRHSSKTHKLVIGGVNNSQVPKCTYVNKLKCFYTNTDTLLNKRLELSALIHEHSQDVIGIT